MAKATKFTGDTQITITPKSKNINYQYTGEGAYIFDINTSVPSGYDSQYKNVAYRNNNDLVVTTIFASDAGKIKTVTTTILGYFTDKSANYTVNYKSTIGDNVEPVAYSLTPNSTPMRDGYYGTGNKEFYKPHYLLAPDDGGEMVFEPINGVPYSNYVYDTVGNNVYSSEQVTVQDFVYDMAGNDEYYTTFVESIENPGSEIYAYDYSGNDHFEANYLSKLHAYDYAGNDKYFAQYGATLNAVDYAGDEKYTVSSTSEATITDNSGKDEYEINGGETNATVTDMAGKDKYNVHTLATATITDNTGKDEYKVSAGATATITDKGKETDIYDISGTSADHTTVIIEDSKGKENYKINGYTNATITDTGKEADTYDISNYSTAVITDSKGKDNYNVTDNSGVTITDYGKDKDKYYVEATSGITSEDFGGNDTYTLLSYTTTRLNDITDYKGNDTYKIHNSSTKITDESGKDKYDISDINTGGQVLIKDTGKGNDSYKIAECYNMTYSGTPSFQITDSKGNETYTITSLTYSENATEHSIIDEAGNDKYNFTTTKIDDYSYNEIDIENVDIYDKAGNDKYSLSIKNADNDYIDTLMITDDSGKDTYSFSGKDDNYIKQLSLYDNGTEKDKYTINKINGLNISDTGGNDTYKITNSSGTIKDDSGNDSYTIKPIINHSTLYISDYDSGKDNYTVDIANPINSYVYIKDRGGKDSLTLSGVNKNDLVFMADIGQKSGAGYFDTGAMYVYNKVSQSFIAVDDFYTNDGENITDFGIGRVESMKAGKTKINEVQTTTLYSDINEIKALVAGYLYDIDKEFVWNVLFEGTDEQRETLAYIFENHEMPSA